MKRLYIIGTSLLAFALQECDYLDQTPQDTIDKDGFFASANAQALEQYCNDLYPKLINGHGNPGEYNFGMMEEDFKSDDILPWDKNDISFGHQTAPTDKEGTEWNWDNIRACNDFLDNYMKSTENIMQKHQYAGEILFFKCLDYFNKVRTYGDVPWYTHALNTTSEDLYKGRDSRIVVIDSIVKNLNQAIEWLPMKKDDGKVYRINKDAALALKARICLFEGTYRRYHGMEGDAKLLEEAYDAAGELMKPEYGHSLFTGSSPSKAYYELFIQSNYNSNPEILFSKEYDPAVGKGNNLTRQIAVGESPIGMSKSCADEYLCLLTGKPISQCGCPGHTTVTTFAAELQNRDPRMLQTIATPEDGEYTYYLQGKAPMIAKVITSKEGAEKYGTSSTGYAIAKYYNPSEYTSSHHQGTLDAPIFRYAEVLLIRAEAGAELGKDPELDKTINALRKRVGFTASLTSSPIEDPKLVAEYPIIKGAGDANLIREIRRERRIEMFGEGLRYSDLMRWACGKLLEAPKEGFIPDPTLYNADEMKIFRTGKTVNDKGEEIDAGVRLFSDGTLDLYGQRVQTPAKFEDPKHYLFAIPLNELSLNPNLKPNNPGW
ncbi:MAG: RagB/SusD family nutrient uptake outer membrane protein [Bacteroides sp.]|nr:RagB/SusD family nutrient uptake outer membrane protein [Bacteroides sp.]